MLKNLKVGVRLAFSFAVMILLLATIAVFSVTRLQSLDGSLKLIINDRYPKVLEVNDAVEQVNIIARALRNMLLWEQPEEIKKEHDRIKDGRTATTSIIKSLEDQITSAEGRKLLADMQAVRTKYMAEQDRIIAWALQGEKKPAIDSLQNEYRALQADYLNSFAALKKFQIELAEKDSHAAEALTDQALLLIVVIGVAAILIAIALAFLITNSIVKPLSLCIGAAEKIAAGDIDIDMKAEGKDELAALQRSMNQMIGVIRLLIAEAGMLTKAAVEGRLATRGDAAKFKGGYHAIVQGVNETLDAVIGPLNVAAAYMDRISKGDIPQKITDSYNGDFNVIKNNLNVCIEAVGALVADAGMLSQAAVEGRLQTRADASKHQGDFRKIVEGVNRTLDLVIDPINETTAILKRMAEGDLTSDMRGDYKGDFDILKTSLNGTIDSINDILGQVSIAVDQVSSGSQQVSQASQALSQGATEQASSLEEITSSVTEISSQTRQNTDNAVQVNTLAKTAKADAEQGNVQMSDLVAAMSDINNSAEEIRKIVKAIDDISFQINLLALNANVEAARAGKYGKGFAVVAEEVRNLAVRSAGSVKETTNMVDEAIANIGRGNELVGVTAKQLSSIVNGAGKVAGLAEEVAVASREQSQALEQISTGLNQIDQVTQSNTASAEESASASEELSSQAQQLKSMVARFKLKERESRMNNADIIAMLRAELARSGSAGAHAPHAAARALTLHKDDAPKSVKPAKGGSKPLVNPADVISLDDDDFGKF